MLPPLQGVVRLALLLYTEVCVPAIDFSDMIWSNTILLNNLHMFEIFCLCLLPVDSSGSVGTLMVVGGSLLVPRQQPSDVSLHLAWSSASSGDVAQLTALEAVTATSSLSFVLASPTASFPSVLALCPLLVILWLVSAHGSQHHAFHFSYLCFELPYQGVHLRLRWGVSCLCFFLGEFFGVPHRLCILG